MIFIFLVLTGAFIAHLVESDSGYVLFSFHDWVIEMSIWAFFIIIIFLTCLVWSVNKLIYSLFNTPKEIALLLKERRIRKAKRNLEHGIFYLDGGDYEQAFQILSKNQPFEVFPSVRYLLASKAADAIGNKEAAIEFRLQAQSHLEHSPTIELNTYFSDWLSLRKQLKKQWNEQQILLADTVDKADPLLRLKDLNEFERLHSDSTNFLLVKARLSFKAGLVKQASIFIESALKRQPENLVLLIESILMSEHFDFAKNVNVHEKLKKIRDLL